MRIFKILKILISYRLDKLLPNIWWLSIIKLLLLFVPYAYNKNGKLPRGVKITNALEELGVIFIKFGQVLSTRGDLLEDDIAEQLTRLQDNCAPFSNIEAIAIIEDSLDKNINEVFDEISTNPIASASIAQVYTAKLKNGKSVVIKVVRPNIEKQIKNDLKILKKLAKIVNIHPQLKRLKPEQIIEEFEEVITIEPDMMAEAVNAETLKRNFANSRLLYVPEVYFDLSSSNILVMERIFGTPISDIQTLKAKNIDLKALAENGTKIFFTQVFEHNFFHADMHPGNIFVADDGTYLGVDFGIMGRLTMADMQINANLFSGFFHRDYEKIATTFIKAGWVHQSSNAIRLENAIRTICEPMFNKPLNEISFGEVLMNLFAQARKFDAYIQPQFLLFDKTLLNIEGLGRQLYPELDLWKTAKPLLDDIMAKKVNIIDKIKNTKNEMPEFINNIDKLPNMGVRALQQLQNLEANNNNQTKQIIAQLQKNQKRQAVLFILLAVALIIFR